MKRNEFLEKLRAQLWALPETDRQCSLDYYHEMIDDRMEDGLTEEEAVAAVGNLDEIVKQILSETSRPPQVVEPAKKQKSARNNTKIWLILLAILGSPVWVSLLITVALVVFSVWISLWAVVLSLYVTAFGLGASSVACMLGSVFMIGGFPELMIAWGVALVCAGLAILIFMLSNLVVKGMAKLTKLTWKGITGMFQGKEWTL